MMVVRQAEATDVADMLSIYNEGIEDRIATLEEDCKDMAYMMAWYQGHSGRYAVLAAEEAGSVIGWADIHPYSHRCAYSGVAELSVYVRRDWRGRGVGQKLLDELERWARQHEFHKLVLGTFPFNAAGQGLYHKMGYREVGVFKNQGRLDGQWVDVLWMEKVFDL